MRKLIKLLAVSFFTNKLKLMGQPELMWKRTYSKIDFELIHDDAVHYLERGAIQKSYID